MGSIGEGSIDHGAQMNIRRVESNLSLSDGHALSIIHLSCPASEAV